MRFISGDTFGMKRFMTSPAKNAPKIPSRPIKSERAALRKRMAMTKVNCITASEYFLRNQRVNLGMTTSMKAQKTTILATNNSQNAQLDVP